MSIVDHDECNSICKDTIATSLTVGRCTAGCMPATQAAVVPHSSAGCRPDAIGNQIMSTTAPYFFLLVGTALQAS
jgi:hypothetical protein